MSAKCSVITARASQASAPALTAFTFCCWAKQSAVHAGNLFHPVMRVSSGTTTCVIFSFKGTNGKTPGLYSSASTTGIASAVEYALSTDVFLAFTMNAGAAALFHGTKPGTQTKVTGTVNTSGTPSNFGVFGRGPTDTSEWFEGNLSNVRAWTAVLSDAEIAAESQSMTRVRNTNIWAEWPLAGASLLDTGGSARDLTSVSTPLTSDIDPPVRINSFFNAA